MATKQLSVKHPTKAELEAYLESLPKRRYINPSAGGGCLLVQFFRDVRGVKGVFCCINSYSVPGDPTKTENYHPIQKWAKNYIQKAMDARDVKEANSGSPYAPQGACRNLKESNAAYNKRRSLTVKELQTLLIAS